MNNWFLKKKEGLLGAGFKSTLIAIFVLFIFVEIALQLRAEIRYGNSIFSSLLEEQGKEKPKLFVSKEGYRTLSPNIRVSAGQINISANALGLRGAKIDLNNPNKKNVVILGASTVYGAYASTNNATFPALLQQRLKNSKSSQYQVINAGIPGNNITSQYLLYSDYFAKHDIDSLIVYPGLSNILASACSKKHNDRSYSLPKITLPKWLLTIDLLLKNTTTIRYNSLDELTKLKVDTSSQEAIFTQSLEDLVTLASSSGVKNIYVVENLKAFNASQPIELQKRLAETTLYYANCFTLSDFNLAFDRLNSIMDKTAKEFSNSTYIEFGESEFNSVDYFADSIHFSVKGEHLMADKLLSALKATQDERNR